MRGNECAHGAPRHCCSDARELVTETGLGEGLGLPFHYSFFWFFYMNICLILSFS